MKSFFDLLLEKRNENDLDNPASRVYIAIYILMQQYQSVIHYLFLFWMPALLGMEKACMVSE